MSISQYQTNLRCGACVAKIQPRLNSDARINSWSADVSTPQKILTIDSDTLTQIDVKALLAEDGYDVLRTITAPLPSPAPEAATTYFPLVLLAGFLLLASLLFEVSTAAFEWPRVMRHFMAGFFLSFAFFKLLDVPAFAASYRMYDLLAKYVPGYAFAYPFLEAALGFAYLSNVMPMIVNAVTLALMLIGTVGVLVSLLQKKKVKCACLGAVFNLPMSYITLLEDVTMAGMAAFMLLA